jgi:uncharacterized membrane protein
MTSKSFWRLRQLSRKLWVRATLISSLAVAAALVAFIVTPYLPQDLSGDVGAEAVDNILSIIASSMLAVTTFSLSTMVTAYGTATSNVTPRATKLIMEDSTTQNVLASFVGSFLFSLVAIITLSMGLYGERGRIVLFVMTVFVVILIVVTLLRWIDYLMRLGRVSETTMRVEEAAVRAMKERAKEPCLGGKALLDTNSVPALGRSVYSSEIGYVGHIDIAALQQVAESHNADIFVRALPGTFIDSRRPLAVIDGGDDGADEEISDAFSIDQERTFDQDPRFGVIVLSEIGQRALSAAYNDSGTAIDVIGRSVRVLSICADMQHPATVPHPRVHVPPLSIDALFDDFFTPIGRDGADKVEVQIRLQKALASLARLDEPRVRAAAIRHSDVALRRARNALEIDEDIACIQEAAAQVGLKYSAR